ncbi:hypothetical protein OKA05_24920 [Luteolibacter arcticus]|uniref:MFS transporter n=1 Tax=Luteolibacter arcticus TaxID=1581411 RepID=A0ABT3GQM3_9BACT|nr:hypothetical protein [Luteolibacter arcticus]MCW1925825.1 hypothetical protein [Luteolibacter arcticus]
MEESPEVPIPPPEIPRGELWAALLLPVVVMCAGCVLCLGVSGARSVDGYDLVGTLMVMFTVEMVMMPVAADLFVRAWGVRYRGRSLVLTTLGFMLGQIVLCMAVWVGFCLIFPG